VGWQLGGKAAIHEAKWVSKPAKVEGEMVGDLSVFTSCEMERTT
jgi:hypothetical protein